MQRYAIIGPDGRVKRIVSGEKPHPDALPVEYPQLSETHVTHEIVQRAFQEWDVQADKVVVTYRITPKSLEQEREAKMEQAEGVRDRHIVEGFTVTLDGNEVRVAMDAETISRVDQAALDAERRPDGWVKQWRLGKGQWASLGPDQIETIRAAGADHMEACFQVFKSVEQAIMAATTLQELADVNIRSGYPEA